MADGVNGIEQVREAGMLKNIKLFMCVKLDFLSKRASELWYGIGKGRLIHHNYIPYNYIYFLNFHSLKLPITFLATPRNLLYSLLTVNISCFSPASSPPLPLGYYTRHSSG